MWTIDEVRAVTRDHQAQEIDGTLCDVQTANAVTVVWEALNADNQAKAFSLPFAKFATFAWRNVS